MDCIFCGIIAKEVPSTRVLEDDTLLVIKDVNPQAPVHLLVLPKKHYATLNDCADGALLGAMLKAAAAAAKKSGVDLTGFRTVVNTNSEGGQTVFHLHMHVIGGRPLVGMMG